MNISEMNAWERFRIYQKMESFTLHKPPMSWETVLNVRYRVILT